MGTSKSFSEVGHSKIPNWGELSGSLTRNCNGGEVTNDAKRTILRNYISSIGGAGIAGRGNSKIGGKSSLKTARKIGSFLGGFLSSGNNIREALKAIGITNIENKSVSDIINHLIEYCSSSTSTIDDKAAKEASRHIFEELVSEAKDIDEIEMILSKRFERDTLEEIIIRYFGYYVYEHLSCWFYEHLIKNKNEADCNDLFRQINNMSAIYIIEEKKKALKKVLILSDQKQNKTQFNAKFIKLIHLFRQ